MSRKSIIDIKQFVPQYFANNREFQVFLRAINIALSVVKSNTDNFIPNLLNPLTCKARLLPLLSNYVGYDYNPRERVVTNRWITKLYPLLIRNRGNEIGITLAVALSICLTCNPEELNLDNNFSMEYEEERDKYGRLIPCLKIYIYVTDYLPILKDMIELVRPAGTKVKFIPTSNVTSSETVVLTDEYAVAKYDYITGKLLSINDIDIVVKNSWEVLIDEHAIKHYKWKHLENWIWGREDGYNEVSKHVELTLKTTQTKLKKDLVEVLNNIEHYKLEEDNIIKTENATMYRLNYVKSDNDIIAYPSDMLVVLDVYGKITVSMIVHTNNREDIDTIEKLMQKSFNTAKAVSRNDLKVVSDYTWGELEDTGIEPYVAMPSLAPYDVANKNSLRATYWNTTSIWLTDGRFYDKWGNDLNRYLDPISGKIFYNDGDWIGEYVKDARIYVKDLKTGEETYTGMYFDVSNPAKVMNTYYKLLDDGIFSGFFLSEDDYVIYDSSNMSSRFKLKEDKTLVNGNMKTVWKVFDAKTDVRYNWHVDITTRKFIRDEDGQAISYSKAKAPFSETTYIGKKAFLMRKTKNEDGSYSINATKYFINKYGDIVDPAGNIILSKKDRYKVSDSSMIGFTEVHDTSKQLSTLDGTNILQREWSFMKDNDIQNKWAKDSVNDYEEYDRVTDPRYKIDHYSFDIGNPTREYTGVELIRSLSNEELCEITQDNGWMNIPLFITEFDNENAEGMLKIKTDIPNNYSLGDVFKTMSIEFENKVPNDEINPKWDIFINWTANTKNKSLFNLNDLENPVHLFKCGTIQKRTLHWTGKPIYISPKIYDGTTKVYLRRDKVEFVNENDN